MYNVRPLAVEFHNADDDDPETSFLGFLLDLFRLGVPEATSNLLTSGAVKDFFGYDRTVALVNVLNSNNEGCKRKRGQRRGATAEVEQRGGDVRLEMPQRVKRPRVTPFLKVSAKDEKKEARVVVCGLFAVGAELLDYERRVAIKRGKRVAEKGGNLKVRGRLERGMTGWVRGVEIKEPIMGNGKAKLKPQFLEVDDSSSDSSIQYLREKHENDGCGPSSAVDLDLRRSLCLMPML